MHLQNQLQISWGQKALKKKAEKAQAKKQKEEQAKKNANKVEDPAELEPDEQSGFYEGEEEEEEDDDSALDADWYS